ncbi:NAD kinase [Mangrovimonas sp. DI 80]|uniref:NAD kinase n=1 Tax=Mangrovimonas sp. DI 80 TaxID=1779330 RepID=UPI000975FD5C|nr:NAD kinase [Mangrovimonas sp. DI 80]OMP31397.1 NAD kinase [Mangrovimonas sp. DI 80]
MKIAIYGQFYNSNTTFCIATLLDFLKSKKAEVYVEYSFFEMLQNEHNINLYNFDTFTTLDNSYDLLISIGGDGTILRAITHVRDCNIPIVGINTGRLGFLATIQTDEIENALNNILIGNYKISERILLSVTTEPENKDLIETNFALNEVAVSRKNTTSMITVETHLDDEYLTSYWSDGLIISTPTGSTGYSLSCGGPVIMPEAHNLVITPIAPHNLNARPLVISDDTKIQLKVDGREDHYLISLDSRITTLHNSTVVTIKKAPFTIKMVELVHESFITTLRKKLLWGEDKRN